VFSSQLPRALGRMPEDIQITYVPGLPYESVGRLVDFEGAQMRRTSTVSSVVSMFDEFRTAVYRSEARNGKRDGRADGLERVLEGALRLRSSIDCQCTFG